jgi:hypothetical protein
VRPYRYWGRPGCYEHFYYFTTPLWRWWRFKGLIRWPHMPRPVERRVLRALDVFLHYTGYAGRYRRRMLKHYRQMRTIQGRGRPHCGALRTR